MSEPNGTQQKEKAAKVRQKPERKSVLPSTFAVARQSASGSLWDREPQGRGLLQRQCACRAHTIGDAECPTCQKQPKPLLPRAGVNGISNTPAIPLPVDEYASRSSHATYDLSQIPTHTGAPEERSSSKHFPGSSGISFAQHLQRLPESSSTSPDQATSTALVDTPATAMSPLPASVQQDHASRVAANDLEGALQVVVQHMMGDGTIDQSLMSPPTATAGADICSSTSLFAVNTAMGGSALTTSCGCQGPPENQVVNVRIEVGPDAIRRIEKLHSTLLHEFRHVRQAHEACNQPQTSSGGGGVCTDCNNPEEMDAYLAQIEAGYDRAELMSAWVRVYVNWDYLAPEQQQVFSARRTAAEQKIEHHFPGVPWELNHRVATYRTWCQQLEESVGENTCGTCNNHLAPLNPPGMPAFPPSTIPAQTLPQGDFPEPADGERVV